MNLVSILAFLVEILGSIAVLPLLVNAWHFLQSLETALLFALLADSLDVELVLTRHDVDQLIDLWLKVSLELLILKRLRHDTDLLQLLLNGLNLAHEGKVARPGWTLLVDALFLVHDDDLLLEEALVRPSNQGDVLLVVHLLVVGEDLRLRETGRRVRQELAVHVEFAHGQNFFAGAGRLLVLEVDGTSLGLRLRTLILDWLWFLELELSLV